MPGIVSSPEAMRLTTNLCLKIQAVMDEAKDPFSWEDINSAKFVTDAARLAMLGLDAMMNECYPIPYKNPKTKQIDMDCKPSSKGLVKLLLTYTAGTKPVTKFQRLVIHEGEKFKIKRVPGNDIWEYEEDVFSEKKTIGYVTIASFEDGTSSVMAHSKADIEKRHKASKSPDSPAWLKWYDEMALAKAARRHINEIPMALPKLLTEALETLDDDDEVPMKDVTPPTIALDAPKAPDVSTPIPEPEPAAPVTQAPARTKNAAKAPETPQINLGFME
jgi:recombinational DNA repair protein RecT